MATAMDLEFVAERKAQRLRLFIIALAVCGIGLWLSANASWYRFEYLTDTLGENAVPVRPVLEVDAGRMASIAREYPASAPLSVSNPQVSQVLGRPIFVVAPLIAVVASMFGLWLRSAAVTALGLFGHLWGWVQASKARWWFEQAPGRESWSIDRGFGQSLYWFSVLAAVLLTVAGSLQALAAYRAYRKMLIANNQNVEETATDLFIRLITRAAVNRTGVSSS